jgi:hypothetical protein
VVAEREHVRPGGEELVGELRSDSRAVGDVLAVDDAKTGAELLLQLRKTLLDGRATGRAEDIRDEENDYGKERAAAGWTESEVWFPASGV